MQPTTSLFDSELFTRTLDTKIARMIKEFDIECEKLTEKQLASVIKQAIQAGDFQINIHHQGGAHSQAVVYIPYREIESLRTQVMVLSLKLNRVREAIGDIEPED